MLIHDVKLDTKDDPTLQNSSLGPSTSSKYDWVLDALVIMLESWKVAYFNIWHILVICDVKLDTKDDPVLQNSS